MVVGTDIIIQKFLNYTGKYDKSHSGSYEYILALHNKHTKYFKLQHSLRCTNSLMSRLL